MTAAAVSIFAADGNTDNRPTGGHHASGHTLPRPAGLEAAGGGGFDAVRHDYMGILRQLSGNDSVGVTEMADLQRRVYQDDNLRGLAKLHRFQLSNATAMAARNPGVFQPIVWLHYETAGQYRSRDDQPLRTPSYLLAADLATSMMRMARNPALKEFATDVMLCTAYTILGDGSRDQASSLFDRVARLRPGNGPALLGAAAIFERRGSYEAAVARLATLVEENPDNHEARLRLAVNLARVGEREAAERQLAELVVRCDREWVSRVGYQELARRLMLRGQAQKAEELLRRALESFPEDHTLAVQLAVVLDARGRPAEAARVVENLRPEQSDRGAAPRWRYSVWPAFDVAAHEAELKRMAESSAPVLRAVLESRTEQSL